MKKVWSEEEDNHLRIYYPLETNKVIADELGVSTQLVSKRGKELGLKKVNRSEIIIKNGVEMKYCRKCEEYLPIYKFSANKNKPNGYNCWCKFHTNEYQANKKLKKLLNGGK